jgi:5-methylcytosine-specific restriction endonuclease McrA
LWDSRQILSGALQADTPRQAIPRKHGGADSLDNLALACIDCNFHQQSDLTGLVPDTSEILPP